MCMEIIDISSGECELGNSLSNFTEYEFEFDGVPCASMEGLIQSLKFDDPQRQREICLMFGRKAKRKGQRRKWWLTRKLFWKGREFNRKGSEYQELLDGAFDALSKNNEFSSALKRTGEADLTHSLGKEDQNLTVLTESEFCSRLIRLRKKMKG